MYIISNQVINQQEQKGRDQFLSFHSGSTANWVAMENKYDVCDITGKTNCEIFIEIKARDIRSTTYSTTFLEVKKYNHLMDFAHSTSTGKAYYFVTFTDSVAVLFDLTKIKNFQQYYDRRWMKEVSLEGQTKMVEKEIYDLPIKLAVKKYKW